MKKEVAKKWVKALRSKKYKQGRWFLKSVDPKNTVKHCCLGVLCELYQEEQRRNKKKPLQTEEQSGCSWQANGSVKNVVVFGVTENSQTLPNSVKRWAGLKTDTGEIIDGYVKYAKEEFSSLAGLNDRGCSFSKIATIIEEHVADL